MPPFFPFPSRAGATAAARISLLLTFLAATPAIGQGFADSISWIRYLEPLRMTLILPMDGPAASLLNPARLASAERGYVEAGRWSGGDARATAFSTGFGFGRRFYLGGYLSVFGGSFEQTNAVIVQNRFGAQFAYRHTLDDEGRGSFSLGLAEASRFVNSLGIFKTASHSLDLGATFVPSHHPGGWRLDFGWSLRDLLPFAVTVPDRTAGDPDGKSHVDFAPWMTIAGVAAESPGRRWTVFGEAAAGEDYEPAYLDTPLPGWNGNGFRGYLPRMGLRCRAASFVSLELARLWNRYWAAGATLATGSWLPFRGEADFRWANGPFREYQLPDKAGWSLAWNLRVLW